MKTNESTSAATFHCNYKMQSEKVTYHRDTLQRDDPIVHEIFLSLVEISTGCVKRMKIAAKVFDKDFVVQRTEERIVRIEVPAGARDGTRLVVPYAGNKRPDTIPSDVVFVIREREHPSFARDEKNNLIYKVNISLREALTGCNIQIPLLCGESLNLSTDDVVSHGTCKRIPGKGMPRRGECPGDLLVHFSVAFPEELTEQQKDAISTILPD